jgi:hypothetical protein
MKAPSWDGPFKPKFRIAPPSILVDMLSAVAREQISDLLRKASQVVLWCWQVLLGFLG